MFAAGGRGIVSKRYRWKEELKLSCYEKIFLSESFSNLYKAPLSPQLKRLYLIKHVACIQCPIVDFDLTIYLKE